MGKLLIDYLGGHCPVQAEGLVDGRPFYFRARGTGWSFGVGDDPIGASMGLRKGWLREGEHDAAGWMEKDEALEIIQQCADEYLAQKLTPPQHNKSRRKK